MSLACFAPPPPKGSVTVTECGIQFIHSPPGEAELTLSAAGIQKQWRDLVIAQQSLDTTMTSTHSSHFLSVKEHWFKKAINTWRDHDIGRALEVLSEAEEDDQMRSTLLTVSASLLKTMLTPEQLATKYSPNHLWSQCPVKALAIHPHTSVAALAKQDDVIVVINFQRTLNSIPSSANEAVLNLRDRAQNCVTCVQWSSHNDSLLAVGVAEGVILWHLDPTHLSSRPVCTLLRSPVPAHPITSVSWSPHGCFLAAGSAADTPLLLWDVSLNNCTTMKRVQGGGVVSVNWSPDGGKLFVSHCLSVFRVWDVANWSCERWTHLSGMCKAACWSPSGDYLLFALEGDPSLYYLCFSLTGTGSVSNSAVKCADLSPTDLQACPDIQVGGCVQTMCWDNRGERLAVIFTPDSPSSDKVAVFRSCCSPILEILPGGFIQGEEGELPVSVEYLNGYQEGALLVTCWSSGRVSFTPMIFTCPASQSYSTPDQPLPNDSVLSSSCAHSLFSQH